MLKNASFLAIVAVHTAKNEPNRRRYRNNIVKKIYRRTPAINTEQASALDLARVAVAIEEPALQPVESIT